MFKNRLVSIAFATISLIVGSMGCGRESKEEHGMVLFPDSVETVEHSIRDTFLGIDVEDKVVLHERIEKKQTLGSLMSKYGVSRKQVAEMERKSKSVFNLRKMKDNPYHIIQSGDSVPETEYFIYEVNPTEYIVYGLKDSITVERYEKELELRRKVVSGTIESSLWNSVVGIGVPFELALSLSNIYAWSIDFFGLQKGDKYEVQYVEVNCDSSFVRIDSVVFARFTHCGTEILAIPFEQNGRTDYYDGDGNSLRKAFLKAPLSYSRISSHFTHSRFHPVLKYYRPHHGVDYVAPMGTPVSTIGDGRVVYKGWTKGGGNTVKIQHNSVYVTSYMHLSKFGKIKQGGMVKQGEVIGFVGSTGVSTGAHLDFRVYENGKPINPLTVKSPPVDPISEENRTKFFAVRDSFLKILE